MASPANHLTLPINDLLGSTTDLPQGQRRNFSAMATEVHVLALARSTTAQSVSDALDQVEELFHEVEARCSRFLPTSELSMLNSAPTHTAQLSSVAFSMIAEAVKAYQVTKGAFDPRVLSDLLRLGYDRTFSTLASGSLSLGTPLTTTTKHRPPLPPWEPILYPESRTAEIGDHTLDLGGIGKGLTVRMSAEILGCTTSSFLIEAGGDCYLGGRPLDDVVWKVGIEDPLAPDRHIAVLGLVDEGCATSSTRVRRWNHEGHLVHHLIDPRTGLPGGDGLSSVTVVDRDPAMAEVWSKTLLLGGARDIEDHAALLGLAAFWVFNNGNYQFSMQMGEKVTWLST